MRRILYIILLLIPGPASHAQPSREDSLKAMVAGKDKIHAKIDACRALAELYADRNFDDCMEYANMGRNLAISVADSGSTGEFERYIGHAWYFKGQYDSAASYYYLSLQHLEKESEKKSRALTLNALGKLYRKTRDLDRALQQYNEALDIYRELKDEEGLATILNESGVVFEYKGDYQEALSRYRRSLEIREKQHDLLGKSYSLSFIGGVYTLMKDIVPARENLEEALEIRRALKDSFALALSHVDLGYMFKVMKDYNRSILHYDSANDIARQLNYPQLQLENYQSMSEIEEMRNNPTRSLMYMKQFTALKDSIMSVEKIKQIEGLNAKYQAEKKEQQLKLKQAEIDKKNMLLWGVILLAGVLIYAGISTVRKNRAQARLQLQQAISREQENAARAIIETEDKERQRIAAELHDGIGQMMSAAKMNLSVFENELGFSDENQKKAFENVISLVDMSCRELRSVSHQMMPNALLKKGLAEAVREFIDRIDKRVISVSLHTEGLDEHIDKHTESVLYRVIQECVNNVLKHAGASHLDISMIRDNDGLSVTIEDDGKGFDTGNRDLQEGIGLKNIRSRIQFLKGTVEYHSSPGNGTLVAIHIPEENMSVTD